MANLQGLLGDPMFAMGAGILANNTGHYGAFGPAVGGGLLAGMKQNSLQQEMQMRREFQAAQIKQSQMKQKVEAEKRAKQQATEAENKQIWNRYQGSISPNGGPPMDPQRAMQQAQIASAANSADPLAAYTAMQPAKPKPPTGYYYDASGGLQVDPTWLATQSTLNAKGASSIINKVNTTAPERKAAGRSARLKQATAEMKALEDAGMDVMSAWDRTISQYTPEVIQSLLRTETGNRISAAENGWLQTHARAESGAAINATEWPMWRLTYFAQPGDDAYSKGIKKRARMMVEEGMLAEAGKAWIKSQGVEIPALSNTEPKQTGKQYSPVLKQNVSQSDIEFTATQEGLTIEEVKSKLGIE